MADASTADSNDADRDGGRMGRPIAPMSRAEADARAAHSNALEGLVLSSRHAALRKKVLSGKITEAQYRAILRDEFQGS